MSWFKKAFKAVGKAAGGLVKGAVSLAKPLLHSALQGIPLVGPIASSLVGKLLPDQPAVVQQQVQEVIQQAAATPATSPEQAIATASRAKQQLLLLGVSPTQASSVGAVVKAATEVEPGQVAQVLNDVHEALPPETAARGISKDDIKVIVDGAIKGAKDGAVDAYTDNTDSGKQAKKEIVETQITKNMPLILGGLLAAFLIFKPKR